MGVELDTLKAEFPVVLTLPVQWGDQDAFSHVNNTIPLRWFESARIAYCERIGLGASRATDGIGPILASQTCNYRRQVTYPETVHIGARITRIGRSSLTMEHRAVGQSSGAVVADATSVVVVFDYAANRSHPVPDPIRRQIEALEGRAFD
jgi:acyl-CoA thioester hydrolase